jgi:flagellum-specific peptidoglycan hydrolase FlgJ
MLENAILEHAKALTLLAEAIKGMNTSLTVKTAITPETIVSEGVADSKSEAVIAKTIKKEPTGPFYWEDTATEFFGKEDTIKALNKQLATKDTIKQVSEERYDELNAALQARNEVAKEKMAGSTKPEKKAEPVETDSAPTLEDLVAAFTKYLPKELDAAERKERHAFVKPMLARFGAAKVTEMKPEFFALAINLVERKMAGEDVDPETADFAEAEVI